LAAGVHSKNAPHPPANPSNAVAAAATTAVATATVAPPENKIKYNISFAKYCIYPPSNAAAALPENNIKLFSPLLS
jgi:hypothetical protein